ncbi:hypothetical protein Rhopal_006786-T1 [Rhodotorula paludigena]|uniref:Uncharacterized protein n=1 Tax=Rhodotorula paludigena TaxID=86838 RepID=A0AAV5GT86_9BASI|nr:hypothetical protein Rhopal_006786-T1 [Rhodotorula paludigena]
MPKPTAADLKQILTHVETQALHPLKANLEAHIAEVLKQYEEKTELLKVVCRVSSAAELANAPPTASGERVVVLDNITFSTLVDVERTVSAQQAKIDDLVEDVQQLKATIQQQGDELALLQSLPRLPAPGSSGSSGTRTSGSKKRSRTDSGDEGDGVGKGKKVRAPQDRFNTAVRNAARTIVRRRMGVQPQDPLPPYPSVSLDDAAYPRFEPTQTEREAYHAALNSPEPPTVALLGQPKLRLTYKAARNDPEIVNLAINIADELTTATEFAKLPEIRSRSRAEVEAQVREALKSFNETFKKEQDPKHAENTVARQSKQRRDRRRIDRLKARQSLDLDPEEATSAHTSALLADLVSDAESEAEGDGENEDGPKPLVRFLPVHRSAEADTFHADLHKRVPKGKKVRIVKETIVGAVQRKEALPSSVQRWAVDGDWARAHPHLVSDVSLNTTGPWPAEQWGSAREALLTVYERDEHFQLVEV